MEEKEKSRGLEREAEIMRRIVRLIERDEVFNDTVLDRKIRAVMIAAMESFTEKEGLSMERIEEIETSLCPHNKKVLFGGGFA